MWVVTAMAIVVLGAAWAAWCFDSDESAIFAVLLLGATIALAIAAVA